MEICDITFEYIKENFPNPETAKMGKHHEDGTYCVGGAFQKALDKINFDPIDNVHLEPRFPGAGILAEEIETWRDACGKPELDGEYDLCWDLVHANDEGDFDKAWDKLKELMA